MLDVALKDITASPLRGVTLRFSRTTHTAIAGPPAAGISTLLAVIAGHRKAESGEVHVGARDVTRLAASRRPLLYATSEIDAPLRWSVRHLLVAAVRGRSLDREDRHHEYELAVAKWRLGALVDTPLRALSSSERTAAHLARIELLRPAILVMDRLLESLNPSTATDIQNDLYRTLRVLGTTVITAPASWEELGVVDRLVVLDEGRVVQDNVPSEVYRHPVSEAAARATGDVNVIPVTVRRNMVESAIGSWETSRTLSGDAAALIRPEDFSVAAPGEESDLIFGVEEASFRQGRWLATGLLSGGGALRVSLPGHLTLHKGQLIALRFDPARVIILPR